MTTTAKIWCPTDESEPEGLFNKASCPHAPPNWFREEPELAAELYALERFGRSNGVCPVFGAGCGTDAQRCASEHLPPAERTVHVLDDSRTLHKFIVKVGYELIARVRAA